MSKSKELKLKVKKSKAALKRLNDFSYLDKRIEDKHCLDCGELLSFTQSLSGTGFCKACIELEEIDEEAEDCT